MKNPLPAFYGLHMIVQAIVSLVSAPALLTLLAWYLHTYRGVGEWIYAPLIIFGVLTGFVSMIRYLLAASAHSAVLEKQAEEKRKQQRKAERQRLSDENRTDGGKICPSDGKRTEGEPICPPDGKRTDGEKMCPSGEKRTEDEPICPPDGRPADGGKICPSGEKRTEGEKSDPFV